MIANLHLRTRAYVTLTVLLQPEEEGGDESGPQREAVQELLRQKACLERTVTSLREQMRKQEHNHSTVAARRVAEHR